MGGWVYARVVLAPGGASGGVVVLGTLAETTVALALGGEATGLAALVDGVGDPVDAGVAADGLVRRVDKDDLVVLVDTVLVDPVRVKPRSQLETLDRSQVGLYAHTEVAAAAADTLLGGALETTLVLEVVDTLADGLAVGGALGDRPLAVSAADTNAVDHVALLGLVAEAAGLVRARRARSAVDHRELAVLPAANARDELQNVRLLLRVELGEVLVGTHLDC